MRMGAKSVEIQHYGKVNLSLHIEMKRPDGYHKIDPLMQEVAVSDILVMKKSDATGLRCNLADVPTDESNLVLRAYRRLQSVYGLDPVRFELQKSIPAGAGMGGGSANAAAARAGLNDLFRLELTKDELAAIGLELGADVPFFLTGGTCRAQGIGEELTPLPGYCVPILLINDGTHAQTSAVYQAGPERTQTTIPELMEELKAKKRRLTVANDLRAAAFRLYPKLEQTLTAIQNTGPATVQLSGTGATFYAVYKNEKEAERAFAQLENRFSMLVLTHTRGEGCRG